MFKKTLITGVVICALLSIPFFCLKVQSQEDNDGTLTVPASFYNDIRTKLAQISAQNEKIQTGVILDKLDQILAGQEEIKQTLANIKTRIGASH